MQKFKYIYLEEKIKIMDTGGQRIEYVDIAKGIGIILVIIGHTVSGILRGVIFSFHMPLFFIVSGITYKYSTTKKEFQEKTGKAFKHLIIVAIFLFCVREFLYILNGDGFMPVESSLTVLFASGAPVEMSEYTIPAIGYVWFLFAFFICRQLCDLLHLYFHKYFRIIICILTLMGVVIGNSIWLPFSLDIALAVTVFFFVGKKLIEKNVIDQIVSSNLRLVILISSLTVVMGLLLELILARNYLELAAREYPLFPICFVVAVAFVIVILIFSNKILNIKFLSKQLIFIGKNSMLLLSIHYLDGAWGWLWRIICTGTLLDEYINTFMRTSIDIIVLYIFIFIKKTYAKKIAKKF